MKNPTKPSSWNWQKQARC